MAVGTTVQAKIFASEILHVHSEFFPTKDCISHKHQVMYDPECGEGWRGGGGVTNFFMYVDLVLDNLRQSKPVCERCE